MMPQRPVATGPLFEISGYQRKMLAAALDPQTKQAFHEQKTIRWAFRITPGVPVRSLRRAFEKLTTRHDSLRLRFLEKAGIWQAEIAPLHPQGLVIQDVSGLSNEEQAAAILEAALEPMSACSDPLFEMILFQCGKAGDVILTRAHHAIMDGYSVAILIEDLLKMLLNMPVLGKPQGHGDFMALTRKRLSERVEEKSAFWEARLLPLPDDPNIGRKAMGLGNISPQTVSRTIRINDILTPSESGQLTEWAKVSGVSTFSILHAAFSETICDLSNQSEFIVLSVLGRTDARSSAFVGADIHPLFLKYQSGSADITERALWVSQQIAAASDQLPTHVFSPDQPVGKAFMAKGLSPARFLVNMGHPSGRLSTSPFSKLFRKGMEGKLSFGFASVERVDLAGQIDTDSEVEFLIGQTQFGANGSIIADAAAFDHDLLIQMAKGIRSQLGFDP